MQLIVLVDNLTLPSAKHEFLLSFLRFIPHTYYPTNFFDLNVIYYKTCSIPSGFTGHKHGQ